MACTVYLMFFKTLRKNIHFCVFKLHSTQILVDEHGLILNEKQKCVIQNVLKLEQRDKKCAKQVVLKVSSCSHAMQMRAKHLLQLLRLQRTLKFTSSFIAERDNRNSKRKPCTFLAQELWHLNFWIQLGMGRAKESSVHAERAKPNNH